MAGPLDLTGQNIENTYQRILQTDGTLIYDGTGSLFNIINSTGSFTGSFTGSLEGTASYALQAFSSSYALSSSLAEAALGAYYATQALNSTFADTASYAIQALNSTFSDTASYALQALNSTLADTASYALLAETSSFVQLIQGPGIIVNGLEITASVQSVNGIFPTNGNISTALTATITGTSASLVVSSSGNVTASLPDGLVWIISNDPTASNNGDSYIFSSGSVGQWYPISTLDVAAADTRYLKLDASNGPMTGNLDMGNYNINNVGTMTGTASYALQTLTASYASSALSSSYALTASYAIGAQTFPYTGSALITGSLGVTGSISTTTNINLLNTTSSAVGVINKGGLRFLHDFKHATGGTAVPTGKNVMLGENAGNFTMGSTATSTQHASYNTLIGTNAGFSTTIGFINTFVGYNAGLNATTGYSNVFFGANSGQNTTTGYFNVYLGERSGQGASLGVGAGTGYNNVGIGALTLTSNTSGFTNVFVGYSAGSANTTGFQNAAIHGGGNNTTGYNNVFVGYNAGGSLADNTANQTSTFSVFLGANTKALSAGNTNQIVIGNNAIGSGSNTVTIGDTNITDNYLRGFLKITGNNKTLPTGNITNQYWNHFTPNTASFGAASIITSSYGLYVEPARAGTNATITNNYAAGFSGSVQVTNGNLTVTGSLIVTGSAEFVGRISQTGLGSSIFIGQNAGFTDDLTTNVNVAIGNSALYFNKDGTNNVAIGQSTLFNNTGSNNVALGAYALQLKTTGGENMAIGTYALNQLSTGSGNVAVGNLTLFNAQGNYNVGIGGNALYDVTGGVIAGRGNIGIGYNTGRGITTGEYNTIIGASVTGLSSSLSNNIIIADGVGNIAFRVNPTTGLTGLTRIIPRTTTNQTATTEISAFIFNGVTTTWQTGTIATQRNFYLPSQTYAFNGASTITNAYGLYAEAPTAGTNATITNNYAAGFSGSIQIQAGSIPGQGIVLREQVGSTTYGAIYFGQTNPGAGNWAIRGVNNGVALNTPAGCELGFFQNGSTTAKTTTTGQWSFLPLASTTGATTGVTITVPSNTNQTTTTNIPNFQITGNNKQWATGPVTNQYWNYLTANTASFVGASTMANSYGLYVEAATAGTNATITNNYAAGFGGNIQLNTPNATVYFNASNGYMQSLGNFRLKGGSGAEVFVDIDTTLAVMRVSNTRALFTGLNVVLSSTALATNATNGFTYIPTAAGAPTGVPTSFSGTVPMIYDTAGDKLYIYNGSWKSVGLS